MKVLIFGATGMVGQGVLLECLRDPEVELIVAVGRTATGAQNPKLHEVVHGDLSNLAAIESKLRGFDACFYCLGVSSSGMKQADYERLTYGFTLAAAETLNRLKPGMTFIYVSGAGTDSTETRPQHVGARKRAHGERASSSASEGLHVPAGLHRAAGRDSIENTLVSSPLHDRTTAFPAPPPGNSQADIIDSRNWPGHASAWLGTAMRNRSWRSATFAPLSNGELARKPAQASLLVIAALSGRDQLAWRVLARSPPGSGRFVWRGREPHRRRRSAIREQARRRVSEPRNRSRR